MAQHRRTAQDGIADADPGLGLSESDPFRTFGPPYEIETPATPGHSKKATITTAAEAAIAGTGKA